MGRRSALSKAEMEVARLVWTRGKATVREVHEALPAGRDVDYKTVQTFLRRLEGKGYLKAARDGRSIVYSPRVRPGKVIQDAVNDFVTRLFGGEALPLVEHLIQARGLGPAEIKRLRKILADAEGRRDASFDK
jgi:BlaI family transcriptional regulator, penicillinase repressor